MNAKEFGAKLKEIRKQQKLTLIDLKAKTGYSDSYLSQIENGYKDLPKPALIRKLAIGLGVSPTHLLYLAGYAESYIETLEPDSSYSSIHEPIGATPTRKSVTIELPYIEDIERPYDTSERKELSDEELRRRVFDLYELLEMNIDLFYKNQHLSKKKKEKIKTMLHVLFD